MKCDKCNVGNMAKVKAFRSGDFESKELITIVRCTHCGASYEVDSNTNYICS